MENAKRRTASSSLGQGPWDECGKELEANLYLLPNSASLIWVPHARGSDGGT